MANASIKSTIDFRKFGELQDKLVLEGLTAAGIALWDDVINMSPKPPINTGNLRGSGTMFIGSKYINKKPDSVTYDAITKPATTHSEPNDRVLTFALDTPYATKMHEKPVKKYTKEEANTDSGPKFVEAKMIAHKEEYFRIAGERIKKILGSK